MIKAKQSTAIRKVSSSLSSDQSLIIMTFEVELKFSYSLLNLSEAPKSTRVWIAVTDQN